MSRLIFLGIITLIFLGDGLYRAFDLFRYQRKVRAGKVNFAKGVVAWQIIIAIFMLALGIIFTIGTMRMYLAL